MNLFNRKSDKAPLNQRVAAALTLMQPDHIEEKENGNFYITLLNSNPYYKSENPLAIAVELLQRAKIAVEPGFQSKNADRYRFNVICK